jgi:ATP-dependent Clp protease ATP-binding subunit ClpB
MDINRMTEKAQAALLAARTLATRNGNPEVDVEHLLLGLLEQENGLIPSVLEKAGLAADTVRNYIEREVGKLPKVSGGSSGIDQIYITARLKKLFVTAEDEARQLKNENKTY